MTVNNLKQKIYDHLNLNRSDIENILAGVDLDKEEIDLLIDLVSIGGLEIYGISEFLIAHDANINEEYALDLEKTLYSRVFKEIDSDIDSQREYFENRVIDRTGAGIDDDNSLAEDDRLDILKKMYSDFLGSEDVRSVVSRKSLVVSNYDQAKADLYEAINGQDKEKFLSALVQLFSSGKIEELFRKDERYIKFWREKILKDHGLEAAARFDENPARVQELAGFIKYVMEKRFSIPGGVSPLWGAYLSALARQAGDSKYEHLAYGELSQGKFIWDVL